MTTELKHYGVLRRSGRYPWGSGGDGYQHAPSFAGNVAKLRKEGLSDKQIAEGLGMSIKKMRDRISIERVSQRDADYKLALTLKEKGMSDSAIGRRMGKNESSIRSLLNPALKEKTDIINNTAEIIRGSIAEKKYIDVGAGVENHLSISKTKLGAAVSLLQEEGYKLQYYEVQQLGTGKYTRMKVLVAPETPYSKSPTSDIKLITDYSEDGGRSWYGLEPPTQISSKRVAVAYESEKDGLIEIRRGVPELELGNSRYSQVRVGVDGTGFLKGMAVHTEDIPDGYDIVYHTSKKTGTPKEDVFKPIKDDVDNPFGSVVRQKHYIDADGNERLSALNLVGSKDGAGEEGSWEKWSNSLSSQVLSKQRVALAKQQLNAALDKSKRDLEELDSLTNPTVKKKLLQTYADGADKAAEELKAAALPRQSNHVLLPIASMKPNEVYAARYLDGENVVLIRHPHGGIFEIPELVVNNKNKEAKSIIGDGTDAVGIHPKVAAKLSGADFDGDTVLVIPNRSGAIRTSSTIQSLQEFDPRSKYKLPKGSPVMDEHRKQREMGDVSNLITDMTIKGAKIEEVVRAVKHSMVVIDAVKHELDYKQSAIDNGISELKKKYQGKANAGASTIVSKASSPVRVDERGVQVKIDPKTGHKIYKETGTTYAQTKKLPDGTRVPVLNRDGTPKIITRKTLSTRMAETSDAFTLSSGTPMESAYATYANSMKALANDARKKMVATKNLVYSRDARETYSQEVAVLKAKLNTAQKNAPMERQAQLLANRIVATKRADKPDMLPADLKKIKGQALLEARNRTGAQKEKIKITDREWEAIQAGAISNHTLSQILENTDVKALKQRALPHSSTVLTPSKLVKARTMAASGHTQAEIASALGVSVSTLQRNIE